MASTDQPAGSLAGIRVVDASVGVAGPLTAMVLADFGADVIKVERPGGDPGRARPGFAVWNRNKRGVVLDDAHDADAIDALIGEADVLVVSDAEANLRQTVRDPARQMGRNPRLVVTYTPPYLGEVPWAGAAESSELLEAASGLALRQYSTNGGPVDSVSPFLLHEQAIWAATSTVAALVERERSGLGQLVTVGGMHAAMVGAPTGFVLDPAVPVETVPTGSGGRNPLYTLYRCADGEWLFLASLTMRFKERSLELLGLDDVADDPRLEGDLDNTLLPANRAWVKARIAEAIATRPRQEWLDLLEAAGCAAGSVLRRDQWLSHPQIDAIGMRVELVDPERGAVFMPGQPLALEGSPAAVRRPAPVLDGDAEDSSFAPRSHAVTGHGPGEAPGPLSGVRIVNLGTILAGPMAGSLLADLGADVIKVEPPEGDPFRRFGAAYNRGVRSVAIDLREPAGRDALLALVRDADVVIDNYRPGILERFGLTYDDLRAVNDDVVALTIMSFGEAGPYAGKLGFDPMLQAMSGMMSSQGGDDDPVYLVVPANDAATAPFTALGACLALFHRLRSGDGQRGWISLAGVSAFLQTDELVEFAGRPPARRGGEDFRGPSELDRYYEAADGWLRVQAAPDQRDALSKVLGAPADDVASIATAVASRGREELVADLTSAGIPAAPARTRDDVIAEESFRAAGLITERPRPGMVPWFLPGRYARFSRTELAGPVEPPGLGEHSVQVLTEAGLAESDVVALVSGGIVVSGPPAEFINAVSYK